MREDIAKEWVAELRSGKYPQTTNYLHVEDEGYCCLGVLCDIHSKHSESDRKAVGLSSEWELRDDLDLGQIYGYQGESGILPYGVQEWAGMRSSIGAIESADHDLTEMNDHGMSFEEISNFIEANWRSL